MSFQAIAESIEIYNAEAKVLLAEPAVEFSLDRVIIGPAAEYLSDLAVILGKLKSKELALSEILNDLSNLSKEWSQVREKLKSAEDKESYEEFQTTEKFHATVVHLRRVIRTVRSDIEAVNREVAKWEPAAPANRQGSARSSSSEESNHKKLPPLPRLRLPFFAGEVSEWKSFWDRFRCMVDERDDTPDVEKLVHLMSCLRGGALASVSGLPITDSNYSVAVTILSEKYGIERMTIQKLYNNLQSLKCVSANNVGLSKFADELEKILMQLEHHGENTTAYSFYVMVLKKLPAFLVRELVKAEEEKKSDDKEPMMSVLRQKLKTVVRQRLQVGVLLEQSDSIGGPRVQENRRQENSQRSSRPTNRFLEMSRSSANNSRRSPPPINSLTFAAISEKSSCLFCSSSHHRSHECKVCKDKESRLKKVQESHRCFKCLKVGHEVRLCPNRPMCVVCGGEHLSRPCSREGESHCNPRPWAGRANTGPTRSSLPRLSSSNAVQLAVTEESNIGEVTNCSDSVNKSPVLLKCVKVEVFDPQSPSTRSEALVLFDDGSTTSYITTELAKKLNLRALDSKTLSFGVFSEPSSKKVRSDIVSVGLVAKDGGSMKVQAHSIKFLTRPVPYCMINDRDRTALRRSRQPLECEYGAPDILIGSDYYYDLDLRQIEKLPSGFNVLHSRLGVVLGGRGKSSSACMNSSNVVVTLHAAETDRRLEEMVEEYFGLDSAGVRESKVVDTLSTFRESVKFNGERYEIKLPWRETFPQLPSNFGLSLGRLRSVVSSLKRKPELLRKYDGIIKEQLDLDIIEEVPYQKDVDHPVHYLPHQPVIREDKGKVRIVYDASAKASKDLNSLNDCLDPGPVLLESLAGVLMRFRIPPIVVACDIEKAFLQVAMNEVDRDVTRFLWLRCPTMPESSTNLVTYRFKRVAFGLTCSPFLLAATLTTHFQQKESKLSKEILASLYVDNIMLSASSADEAQKKCILAKSMFKEIGMNLREFVSNNGEAIGRVAEEDKLTGAEQRFLGISWNVEKDVLEFTLPTFPVDKVHTKRSVLATIALLFDPLGILGPVLLGAKLFFQRLWKLSKSWDERFDQQLKSEWQSVVEGWSGARFSVPRSVESVSKLDSELHVFTDASFDAYACCVYLVTKNELGKFRCQLVFAKTRVRPTRCGEDFSIHRMELLGVSIGVKAVSFVREQLLKDGFSFVSLSDSANLWTDSSTVLHWLRGTSKQQIFVENRLGAIRKVPNLMCRYVPTEDNPADVASRGCTATELSTDDKWWSGPHWLIDQKHLPTRSEIPPFDSNAPRDSPSVQIILATIEIVPLVDISRFSSIHKLVRVVAYVFRFLCRVKALPARFSCDRQAESVVVSVEERGKAKLYLLLESQKLYPPSSNEKRDLGLYTDVDGLLRSKGRLERSGVGTETANPIYLPPKSPFSRLLIFQEHRDYLHSGALLTLSQLRRRFWIPKGRRTVKSAIKEFCMVCRRLETPAFQVPNFPQLPAERVKSATPFQNSGVDYFGPINVTLSTKTYKVWVALFTCLVVRAIHLEVVYDLSAASFLQSFQRFVARRGLPKVLWSDNGTQFTLAAKTLDGKFQTDFSKISSTIPFSEYLSQKGVRWEFITENAPWKGGFYERMVGLVKSHLRKCVGRELLDVETFTTLIAEVEMVVNLRPITFLTESSNEKLPLRPMDFLNSSTFFRSIEPLADDGGANLPASNQKNLLTVWNENDQRVNKFWKDWYKDYLLSLRERQRMAAPGGILREPVPGEVVLVFENDLPRHKWKTAVVEGGEPKEDGRTRSARIRLPSGHITKRAICHLFPLETSEELGRRL